MFRVALGTAFVVGSVLLTCKAQSADPEGGEGVVPLLTHTNFEEKMQEKPHFVMFFAPWCGHCKKLAPVWEDLHLSLGGFTVEGSEALDVGVAKVDCTEMTALCSKHQITGYPTLMFFKSPEDSTRYKGARSLDDLTLFVKKQLGLVKEPEPVEESSVPSGPVVHTVDSFGPAIATGHHFVKFYAPWCGHCQRLAPIWDQLSESFTSTSRISIAKVDCTQHKELCIKHGIKGYPTLLWFTDGEQVGDKYAGDRSLEVLRNFALEQAKKPSQPVTADGLDRDSTPSQPESQSAVSSLLRDTFDDSVAKGITLVKFFAPWCGHCKKMAGAYEALGTQFKDHASVTIAEVDCTEQDNRDLCSEQEVKGFPTIIVYKDGSGVATYEGDRTTGDMAKFVTSQLKHDEL